MQDWKIVNFSKYSLSCYTYLFHRCRFVLFSVLAFFTLAYSYTYIFRTCIFHPPVYFRFPYLRFQSPRYCYCCCICRLQTVSNLLSLGKNDMCTKIKALHKTYFLKSFLPQISSFSLRLTAQALTARPNVFWCICFTARRYAICSALVVQLVRATLCYSAVCHGLVSVCVRVSHKSEFYRNG